MLPSGQLMANIIQELNYIIKKNEGKEFKGKNRCNVKQPNNSGHQNDVMYKIYKRATWNTNELS